MTPEAGSIGTAADLAAIARAIAERSADQYRDLAEAFVVSCNPDTADAFRELAGIGDRHAADFPEPTGPIPDITPWGEKDPEIADPGAVHYLMHPWHAFDLALRHEETALAFFEAFATRSPHAEVRTEAARLAGHKRDHMAHLRQKLAQFPEPPDGWDEDEDPPNWDM